MDIIENEDGLKVLLTNSEKKKITKALTKINKFLVEQNVGIVETDTVIRYMNRFLNNNLEDKNKNKNEICKEALMYAYVNTLYDVSYMYTGMKKKDFTDFEEDIKKKGYKSSYKYITSLVVDSFKKINEKVLNNNSYDFLLIEDDKLRDEITSHHSLYNSDSASLNFYLNPKKLLKKDDTTKLKYITYANKNVSEILDKKDNAYKTYYLIALNYQNILRIKNQGLFFFKRFSTRYKTATNALREIEDKIMKSNHPLLNSIYKKEQFIKYCKTGHDKYHLDIYDLNSVVYSPIYTGILNDKIKEMYKDKININKEKINVNLNDNKINIDINKDIENKKEIKNELNK